MKYVKLSPRGIIRRIFDEDAAGRSAISDAKAVAAQALKDEGSEPLLFQNEVTTVEAETAKQLLRGNTLRLNVETNEWEIHTLPIKVPESVSMSQLREELSKPDYNVAEGVTLRMAVQQAVDAADIVIQDWWNTSTSVRRYNEKTLMIQEGLGVSDAAMDAIWIGALKN